MKVSIRKENGVKKRWINISELFGGQAVFKAFLKNSGLISSPGLKKPVPIPIQTKTRSWGCHPFQTKKLDRLKTLVYAYLLILILFEISGFSITKDKALHKI